MTSAVRTNASMSQDTLRVTNLEGGAGKPSHITVNHSVLTKGVHPVMLAPAEFEELVVLCRPGHVQQHDKCRRPYEQGKAK